MTKIEILNIVKQLVVFAQRHGSTQISPYIFDMHIRSCDVQRNPINYAPVETSCHKGICSMKQCYHCLRTEEHVQHMSREELVQRITFLAANKKVR